MSAVMPVGTQTQRRAFAVGYRDLQTWNVGAQLAVDWNWPNEAIQPLASIVTRRNDPALRLLTPDSLVTLLTIRFDGSVEPREPVRVRDIRGRLFRVQSGDVVLSKIDVRNGAIGLAPDTAVPMCVTSEFPVYSVDASRVDPDYVKLLFRTISFKRLLNSMISGASGRKRIQPSQLEQVKVPIPPLPDQQRIVAHHRASVTRAGELFSLADRRLEDLERDVLEALGLKRKMPKPMPKVMVPGWSELAKWSQRATFLLSQKPDLAKGSFAVVKGRDCMTEVRHGCSASPSSKRTTLKVLKLSAVTSGHFLPSEAKFIADTRQFRNSFDLRRGDILMCRTNGTLAYVGRSVLVGSDCPDLIFPDKLMRVRCKENVLAEYLEYVLGTSIARPQIEAYARTAVGNYAIGNEDVYDLELPLPPVTEQGRLAGIVAKAREEASSFKAEADDLKRRAEMEVEQMILGGRTAKVG